MKINYENPQFKWGITAFAVLAAAILFFFVVFKFPQISVGFGKFVKILMPIIYGLIFAYLLCPIYNFFIKHIFKSISRVVAYENALRTSRALSTLITMTLAVMVIGGLFSLVLPQLIESLISLVKTAPQSATTLIKWVNSKLSSNSQLNSALNILLGDYTARFNKWLQDVALPWLLAFAPDLSNRVVYMLLAIKDVAIGIIICIYALNIKDAFKAQTKKLAFSLLKKREAAILIKEMAFINKTFSAFISGKIIDSFIIGVICFIVMSIFHLPYVLLISVIIGVTNIIPFFGPFIGAIPSTIIMLTVDPIKALYFVIFILILQQIDGNIIGPKILGDSTGLPSFWVMFAILVGGGMFGFVGMIVGIPIFAVIYVYVTRYVNHKLKSKGLPIETNIYKEISFFIPSKHRLLKKR
ncbi:MAG: AI-2E family transporter [Eubacteriales bacterium]